MHQGSLYVGGCLNGGAGVYSPGIVRWDGYAWHSVGGGVGQGSDYSYVLALESFGGDVIAGGIFTSAGGTRILDLARWTGVQWVKMGGSCNGHVCALRAYGGDLFVSGEFTSMGGVRVDRIARWSGSLSNNPGCHACGSGLDGIGGDDGWASAMTVHENDLYVGGWFEYAGWNASQHIARWSEPAAHPPGEQPIAALRLSVPSPYRIGAPIVLARDSSSFTKRVTPFELPAEAIIVDITGRRIRTLLSSAGENGSLRFTWDGCTDAGSRVAAGIYFIRGQHETLQWNGKIMLVE